MTIWCFVLLASHVALAGEGLGETAALYGYATQYTQVGLDRRGGAWREPTLGEALLLRLKADFRPHDALVFHAESSWLATMGNQNTYVLLDRAGLGVDQDLHPLEDFHQKLIVDHAWGAATLGRVTLKFGRMPIGWGTAWFFNPTQRVALPPFLDMVTEETPGTMALEPTFAPLERMALTGYLAFEDKGHKTTALAEDMRLGNLPWGLRCKLIAGPVDLSASVFREVVFRAADPETWTPLEGEDAILRTDYAGLDFATFVAWIGIYGEAAFVLHSSDGVADAGLAERLESTLGLEASLPGGRTDLKLEYFFQGTGEPDPDGYDLLRVLQSERVVLGRHYLAPFAEVRFRDDLLRASVVAVINLGDGSAVALPTVTWSPLTDLQFTAGMILSAGAEGTEFSGTFTLPWGEADLVDSLSVFARVKMAF